jgi:hypothetical protein
LRAAGRIAFVAGVGFVAGAAICGAVDRVAAALLARALAAGTAAAGYNLAGAGRVPGRGPPSAADGNAR